MEACRPPSRGLSALVLVSLLVPLLAATAREERRMRCVLIVTERAQPTPPATVAPLAPSTTERMYRYDQARARSTLDAYRPHTGAPDARACYDDPWRSGCR